MLWYWAETLSTGGGGHNVVVLGRNFVHWAKNIMLWYWAETLSMGGKHNALVLAGKVFEIEILV